MSNPVLNSHVVSIAVLSNVLNSASPISASATTTSPTSTIAATGFMPVERRLDSYKLSPKPQPGHHRPRAGGAMTGQLHAASRRQTRQRQDLIHP